MSYAGLGWAVKLSVCPQNATDLVCAILKYWHQTNSSFDFNYFLEIVILIKLYALALYKFTYWEGFIVVGKDTYHAGDWRSASNCPMIHSTSVVL